MGDGDYWYAEEQKRKGQLQNLLSNTRTSSSNYDSDVTVLSGSLDSLDKSSPIMEEGVSRIREKLSTTTHSDGFDSVISRVNNAI